jgi:hypothetical protein
MQTTPTPLPTPAFITATAATHYGTFKANLNTIFTMADIGSYSLDSIQDMAFSLPSALKVVEYLGQQQGLLVLRVAFTARMREYIDTVYLLANDQKE